MTGKHQSSTWDQKWTPGESKCQRTKLFLAHERLFPQPRTHSVISVHHRLSDGRHRFVEIQCCVSVVGYHVQDKIWTLTCAQYNPVTYSCEITLYTSFQVATSHTASSESCPLTSSPASTSSLRAKTLRTSWRDWASATWQGEANCACLRNPNSDFQLLNTIVSLSQKAGEPIQASCDHLSGGGRVDLQAGEPGQDIRDQVQDGGTVWGFH